MKKANTILAVAAAVAAAQAPAVADFAFKAWDGADGR